MMKHLYILTGAARGMGLAMAQHLLKPDHFLLCVSRHTNESLTAAARAMNAGLEQWPLDLEHPVEASARLAAWLASQSPGAFASATLVNNAAVLPRIAPLSQADSGELSKTLRVGLEAPMQLTVAFLRSTEAWADVAGQSCVRKVLNISSGNGRRAMASQAIYSATKAGMDHFTRCVALDEALKANGATVCSLAPGVIDTDMQSQLRHADSAAFPDRESFVRLQSGGQLSSPDEAASRVLAYLARPDFGTEPVADVRG